MSNLQVANTILEQLGGRRFVAMTGAKNLVGSDNSLSFKIGRNGTQVNCVRVELTPADTYTVTFSKAWKSRTKGFQLKEIERVEDVYFDMLQDVFTRHTGMYTRF